ncbi:hypothetical protein LVB87_03335 [Lysobacter sp. KIS68-7]|uniref:XAC0095 family protein n=1 Tax=Lysobacter sp. KIS68-7 TaxID=2904252 RepID=UPI001E59FBFD|nr:hypothetical protein [Lysobacter sp. KIS68-7]UHQ20209.1 hypothetical protein LVB87_03335 [Lysobacter sp. KIS68-7]
MSEKSDTPQRASTVYAIPEAAHTNLVQLRDHLHLMAKLTAVGTNASRHDAKLRPDALAWWFSRLHKEIDAVLAATCFSTELANAWGASLEGRKGREASRQP